MFPFPCSPPDIHCEWALYNCKDESTDHKEAKELLYKFDISVHHKIYCYVVLNLVGEVWLARGLEHQTLGATPQQGTVNPYTTAWHQLRHLVWNPKPQLQQNSKQDIDKHEDKQSGWSLTFMVLSAEVKQATCTGKWESCEWFRPYRYASKLLLACLFSCMCHLLHRQSGFHSRQRRSHNFTYSFLIIF